MEFYSSIKWRGQIAVTPLRRNEAGVWVPSGPKEEFPNLIVNGGLDLIAAALESSAATTQINYFALGNDNTAAAATDTQLGAEQFRKLVTSYTTGVTTGEIVTTGYVAPAEANSFTIEEIGWFVGGTATANSGTMFARVVYNRTKTASEALQIDRTDTFT